jgi:DegV family protein with EDD domain
MMIRIVTDTTAGLPRELTAKLNILVLPQIVIFGEKSYRDDTELDTLTFLELLRTSPQLPKTSAPSPALYDPIINAAIKNGDTLLFLHPSSKISGTVRSAQVASQDHPTADIRIIDTQTVACNLGSMVLLANQWAKEGLDADSIQSRLEEMIRTQRIYFLVDKLEFLHKGGRIGGAKALIGEMLQVKPILTINNRQVVPYEQQRTKRRSVARMVEIVKEQCPPEANSHLCVMHADALTEAQSLALQLKESLVYKDIPIYEIPPAIVVHAGPKVLGVGFFVAS